jgi:hypothetical protein
MRCGRLPRGIKQRNKGVRPLYARKRLLDGGDFSQDVRITVLFDTVLMIHRERETVRKPLRPFFDAIEDPCWLRKLGNGMPVVDDKSTQENATDFKLSKLIGPGLMVAAAGIGAGDIVSATMGGAGYGLTILWAVALAAFLKCFLNEGIARWQLATNTTAIEGWCSQMPWWVRTYFGIYLVIWTGFVTAALTNACGLGIENLTGGAIPRSWGAVLHSVIGAVFILIGGFRCSSANTLI